MRRAILFVAIVGAWPIASARAAGAPGANPMALVQKSGDLVQVGLPLAALGLTFLLDAPETPGDGSLHFDPYGSTGFDLSLNGSPRHDLALAFARAELATYSLKYAVDAQRPNGGGQSFPSGHTALAFTGAEFIRKTYGWEWGVPSYLLAGFVGWSRVASNNHYTRDVIAGAALGILSNHDLDDLQVPLGHGLNLRARFALTSTAARLDGPTPLAFVEPGLTGESDAGTVGLHFELRFP